MSPGAEFMAVVPVTLEDWKAVCERLSEALDLRADQLERAWAECDQWKANHDEQVARKRRLHEMYSLSLAREQRTRAALEKIVDEFTNGLTANMEYVRQTAKAALSSVPDGEQS